MKITTLIVACLLACLSATAQENSYQRPPKVIEEMALAPLTPTVDFNSDYSQMMLSSVNHWIVISALFFMLTMTILV